jgi:hypothetical protein
MPASYTPNLMAKNTMGQSSVLSAAIGLLKESGGLKNINRLRNLRLDKLLLESWFWFRTLGGVFTYQSFILIF